MPPEPTGDAAAQAAAAAQPQAGTTTSAQAAPADKGQAPAAAGSSGTDAGKGGDSETADARAERLERENRDLLKEIRGLRTTNGTLTAAQKAAAQAGLTELEQAQADAKTEREARQALEAKLTDQAIRNDAYTAASKLGFKNPDVAYRLLDRADVEFNADGDPKNVERLLKDLLAKEPYLGTKGGDFGGGDRGTTPPTQPTMNQLIRAAAGRG